jgi:hypothetical protein
VNAGLEPRLFAGEVSDLILSRSTGELGGLRLPGRPAGRPGRRGDGVGAMPTRSSRIRGEVLTSAERRRYGTALGYNSVHAEEGGRGNGQSRREA